MSMVSQNIFAALDTRKKKKSSKSKDEDRKKVAPKADKTAELEKAVFSQPINALSSWADESDEEEYHHHQPANDGWNAVRCCWPPLATAATTCPSGGRELTVACHARFALQARGAGAPRGSQQRFDVHDEEEEEEEHAEHSEVGVWESRCMRAAQAGSTAPACLGFLQT